MLGTYGLSNENFDSYYRHAQKARTLIRSDFMRVLDEVNAIIAPTTPTVALEFGKKKFDPLQMYLCDIFAVQANMVRTCGISIPCGMSSDNLPIGMQILGKPFKEYEILSLASEFESAHEYKNLGKNQWHIPRRLRKNIFRI
jgi:aspartyl-tRNA(Asn)/glutamyl-tRNA(Gln) amidotransferase subunit A